jgi:hypothetical protein
MLAMVDDDGIENKPTGRRKGGLARADALSDERKKEIAQKGALARWGAQATHKGNFKEEFGIDVDCYVLDDANKTAVISQRGMGAALGMGIGGSRLPRLVNSNAMADYVGPELRQKLEKPIVFQAFTGGPNSPPPSKVHGYDVTILVDVCKAVVAAEAAGRSVNPAVARQAHIILSASAKAGIKGLVYALSGYDATREEVIQAFKLYVQEEAKKYEKEFPPELYSAWQKLYEIELIQGRGKPWEFMHLTVKHIYMPLAKSNGRLLELLRALKARGGQRGVKLFQFLNEIGSKALRLQIGRVLEMAEDSSTPAEYEAKIVRRFGGQTELDLVVPPPP